MAVTQLRWIQTPPSQKKKTQKKQNPNFLPKFRDEADSDELIVRLTNKWLNLRLWRTQPASILARSCLREACEMLYVFLWHPQRQQHYLSASPYGGRTKPRQFQIRTTHGNTQNKWNNLMIHCTQHNTTQLYHTGQLSVLNAYFKRGCCWWVLGSVFATLVGYISGDLKGWFPQKWYFTHSLLTALCGFGFGWHSLIRITSLEFHGRREFHPVDKYGNYGLQHIKNNRKKTP